LAILSTVTFLRIRAFKDVAREVLGLTTFPDRGIFLISVQPLHKLDDAARVGIWERVRIATAIQEVVGKHA